MKKKLILLMGLLVISGGRGSCVTILPSMLHMHVNVREHMLNCFQAKTIDDANRHHQAHLTDRWALNPGGHNQIRFIFPNDRFEYYQTTVERLVNEQMVLSDYAKAIEICTKVVFQDQPAYAELSATLRHRVEEAIHKTRLLEEGAAATTALRTEVDAAHARLTESDAARAAADARNAELMRRLEAMEVALAKAECERDVQKDRADSLQESLDAHIEQRRQEAERAPSLVRARTSGVDPAAVAQARSETPTVPRRRVLRVPSNLNPDAAQIAVAQDAAERAADALEGGSAGK